MNVEIRYMARVKEEALDGLARELPAIIAGVLEVPGGKMAIVRPEQVSLEFSPASSRDVGDDIRIKVFARSNDPRTSTEHALAREILDKVMAVVGGGCSIDVRLYLLEVGKAHHLP